MLGGKKKEKCSPQCNKRKEEQKCGQSTWPRDPALADFRQSPESRRTKVLQQKYKTYQSDGDTSVKQYPVNHPSKVTNSSAVCIRCLQGVKQVRRLLDQIKCYINETDQLKCNYCLNYAEPKCCKKCDQRFMNYLKSKPSAYLRQGQLSNWITSVKQVLTNILDSEMICPQVDLQSTTTASDELERLIEELRKPLSVPKDTFKITSFPFSDEVSNADVSFTLAKKISDNELDVISEENLSKQNTLEEEIVGELKETLKFVDQLLDQRTTEGEVEDTKDQRIDTTHGAGKGEDLDLRAENFGKRESVGESESFPGQRDLTGKRDISGKKVAGKGGRDESPGKRDIYGKEESDEKKHVTGSRSEREGKREPVGKPESDGKRGAVEKRESDEKKYVAGKSEGAGKTEPVGKSDGKKDAAEKGVSAEKKFVTGKSEATVKKEPVGKFESDGKRGVPGAAEGVGTRDRAGKGEGVKKIDVSGDHKNAEKKSAGKLQEVEKRNEAGKRDVVGKAEGTGKVDAGGKSSRTEDKAEKEYTEKSKQPVKKQSVIAKIGGKESGDKVGKQGGVTRDKERSSQSGKDDIGKNKRDEDVEGIERKKKRKSEERKEDTVKGGAVAKYNTEDIEKPKQPVTKETATAVAKVGGKETSNKLAKEGGGKRDSERGGQSGKDSTDKNKKDEDGEGTKNKGKSEVGKGDTGKGDGAKDGGDKGDRGGGDKGNKKESDKGDKKEGDKGDKKEGDKGDKGDKEGGNKGDKGRDGTTSEGIKQQGKAPNIPIPKGVNDSPTAKLLQEFIKKSIQEKKEGITIKPTPTTPHEDDKTPEKISKAVLPEIENEEDTKSNISTDSELFSKDSKRGKDKCFIKGNRIVQIKEIRNGKYENIKVRPRIPAKIKSKRMLQPTRSLTRKSPPRSPENPVDQPLYFKYELSDPNFITNGYTVLPEAKTIRIMYNFKTTPSHYSRNWFDRHRGIMFYDTGEKLAEVDEDGVGRWFYKNGSVALNYYKSKDPHSGFRTIVYSSGNDDKRGQKSPVTILAVFDDQGNGIVFDHCGKVRLKYNQTEGQVIDCTIGAPSRWLWHTLNEPPVLDNIFVEKQENLNVPIFRSKRDLKDDSQKTINDKRVEVEYENLLKEKIKKVTSTGKTFNIMFKIFKLNDEFALHIVRQERIELLFRSGTVSLKMHLGTVLDSTEIVDTDVTDLTQTFTPIDNEWDPKTESIDHIRNVVKNTKNQIRRMKNRNKPRCVDFNPVCHKDCYQPLQ